MEIVPFEAGHAAGVTRLVNTQIALVPPHWQLSEDHVWAILQKQSLWEIHYQDEEPPPWTWTVETVCVVEGEQVLAAARFDYRYDEGQLGMVSGRWLVSDPKSSAAVDLLLDYLIAKRGDTTASILVNGRSDFGIGWSGIPTSDTYLKAALEAKGFVADQKWLIMTADIAAFASDTEPLPALDPLRLEWAINESRLERHLNLYDGETLIGECQSWGIPPEFAACPDYERWMQIEWLGVEEIYRRRGLARHMMQAQFGYHATRGKRRCMVYTDVENTATRALNAVLGFSNNVEVWGWTWKPD